MSSNDAPEGRCGFVLEPKDVKGDGVSKRFVTGSDEWYEFSDAAGCWRPVWTDADTDRCIWHAKTEDKPADELVAARADNWEVLDGAYVPAVDLSEAIDFEECRLWAATFGGTGLRGVSFAGVNSRFAQFPNTDLQDAEFPNTDLAFVEFPDANLRNARFSDASLRHAQYPDAHLEATQFLNADLYRARFSDAVLIAAEFPDANLRTAEFRDANLQTAEFPAANLRNTVFFDANLTDANLSEADIYGAYFEGADLTNANLFDSDLRGTALYGAIMENVSINRRTKFGGHYGTTISGSPPVGPAPPKIQNLIGRLSSIGHETRLAISPSPSDSKRQDRLEKAAWSFRRVEQLSDDAGLAKQARSYNVQRKDIERRLYLVEDGSRLRWAMAMASSLSMRYGERPWRVVVTSLAVILGWTLLYPRAGGIRTTTNPNAPVVAVEQTLALPDALVAGLEPWLTSFYFSVVTFTTLGYGDLQPATPTAQLLATAESFIGALLMALLVYVLGRRATW